MTADGFFWWMRISDRILDLRPECGYFEWIVLTTEFVGFKTTRPFLADLRPHDWLRILLNDIFETRTWIWTQILDANFGERGLQTAFKTA